MMIRTKIRIVLPLVCFLLCGCTSRVIQREITDSSGSNKLILVDRECQSIWGWARHRRLYDFDSLVWRSSTAGKWHDRIAISQAAFQRDCPRRRWVSELYSFNPTNGAAVIKVAEGDKPEGAAATIHYVYSWREWNLPSNVQVRVLKVCSDPFQKYEP